MILGQSSGVQTLSGATLMDGDVVNLTASQNDFSPPCMPEVTSMHINAQVAGLSITGFDHDRSGRLLRIVNIGALSFTLVSGSGASALRHSLNLGGNIVLAPGAIVDLYCPIAGAALGTGWYLAGTSVPGAGGSASAPQTLTNKTINEANNTLIGVFSASNILRTRDYNILPSNTAAQNDTGFAALKAAMQVSASTTWLVIFEPGTYLYTNNRWLFGVNQVILIGYSTILQNVTTDANFGNAIPLNNGAFFLTNGDTSVTSVTYANGFKINTANAGAGSITTATAADAGQFSAGMSAIIYGYDQQGNTQPPNMRYFEYVTVASVNAGTGVVTLVDPLRNFYDSRWWDTTLAAFGGLNFGAPRIYPLGNTAYSNYNLPTLIWLQGLTFLTNPTTPTANTLQLSGQVVIYENITAPAFNVVQSNKTIIRNNCSFSANNGSTCDKLVDTAIIQDSTIDGTPSGGVTSLTDCVGVNNISVMRTRCFGGVQISPRSASLSGNDIIPATSNYSAIATSTALNPVRSFELDNNRVFNTGQSYGFSNVATPGESLTVGSVVGTDILIPFDATGKAVAYSVDYGMTLTNTVTGNTGIITGIYYVAGSPGNLRLTGTWSAPTAGDVFHYYDVMAKYDSGGNVIIGTQIPLWRAPPSLSSAYLVAPVFTGGITVDQINIGPAALGNYLTNDGANNTRFFHNFSLKFFLDNVGLQLTSAIINGSSGCPVIVFTAPTIISGFGAGASVTQNDGPSSFSINVGTGGAASSGVIGLPNAPHGWSCCVNDVTNPDTNSTVQTASTTNSVTVKNYSRTTGLATAWPASDTLQVSCWAN
jgi:hypothetical protein